MIPGKAKLVKCPYCGAEKELMALISGNTCGAEHWSDNKRIAPMLPEVSPVQKCPECGKYYIEHKQQYRKGDDYSFEQGQMPFADWKNAYLQFQAEEIEEKELMNVRYWLVQSFNDTFYRNEKEQLTPTTDEYSFFSDMINILIDYLLNTPDHNPLFIAELYREANNMEKCAEVLKTISYDELKDHEKVIYDGINNNMKQGNTKVFRFA